MWLCHWPTTMVGSLCSVGRLARLCICELLFHCYSLCCPCWWVPAKSCLDWSTNQSAFTFSCHHWCISSTWGIISTVYQTTDGGASVPLLQALLLVHHIGCYCYCCVVFSLCDPYWDSTMSYCHWYFSYQHSPCYWRAHYCTVFLLPSLATVTTVHYSCPVRLLSNGNCTILYIISLRPSELSTNC